MLTLATVLLAALAASVQASSQANVPNGESQKHVATLGRHMLRSEGLQMSMNSRSLQGINAKRLVKTSGIDTSGSQKPFGNCNGVNSAMLGSSNWCQIGSVSGNPSDSRLKYGRQTIYGPGGWKGWCGVDLGPSDWAVPVAISTRYLPLDGVSPNSQYCGQCLCARTVSTDLNVNPTPPGNAYGYYGKVFKGIVQDMCPECCADCIDVLGTTPYTNAVPLDVAYGVGVWTVEWNFVSCNTDCNKFFKGR